MAQRSAETLAAELLDALRQGNLEELEKLLAAGADANTRYGGYRNTALMMVNPEGDGNQVAIIRSLVRGGADVRARNAVGETALHLLAGRNSPKAEILSVLLESGADLEARDEKGWTPLLSALDLGSPIAVETLLAAGADVNTSTPGGRTAWSVLEHAAATYDPVRDNRSELEKLLRHAGARRRLPEAEHRRQLIHRVEQADLEGVRRLLAAGADSNAKAGDESPVLYLAVRDGHHEIAEALLQAGADPDALDLGNQKTALVMAVLRNDLRFLWTLFVHGASPEVIGRHERPVALPLYGIRNREIFPLLLQHRVAPSKIRLGKLLFASREGDLELLRELLAEDKNFDVSEIWAIPLLLEAAGAGELEIVEELLSRGADPDTVTTDASTPLMWAASRGHLPVVRALIKAGADLNARQIGGWTALTEAIRNDQLDVVQTLLAAGAATHLPDSARIPLHLAASRGQADIVQELLLAGAPLDLRGEDQQTALMWALESEHQHIVELLLAAGAKADGTGLARPDPSSERP